MFKTNLHQLDMQVKEIKNDKGRRINNKHTNELKVAVKRFHKAFRKAGKMDLRNPAMIQEVVGDLEKDRRRREEAQQRREREERRIVVSFGLGSFMRIAA